MAPTLTVGELAERSGVATSALRYYEERGLIGAERTPAGHRRYPRAIIRRVAFIVFAQRVGMSLEEIGAELARLPDDRVPERADWDRLSRAWRERIDGRIAELERLRESLGECIGCGCLSLDRCALANPGDRAGRQGAGPRYWIGDPRPATSGAGGVGSAAESIAPRRGPGNPVRNPELTRSGGDVREGGEPLGRSRPGKVAPSIASEPEDLSSPRPHAAGSPHTAAPRSGPHGETEQG